MSRTKQPVACPDCAKARAKYDRLDARMAKRGNFGIVPLPQACAKHRMPPTPAIIEELAEAFLRWPLPDSVCADLCTTKPGPGRVGTNLLSYTEAKQMFSEIAAKYLP